MGSARPGRRGCWSRSATSPGSRTGPTSRPGPAPHRSTRPPATTSATGSRAPATGRSTGSCTSWPPSSCATPGSAATTTTARKPPARPRWKRCAASNADSQTSSTGPCSTTPPPTPPVPGRAREGTGERHSHPARPAHIPTPTLRISHFPDPSATSLRPPSPPRLDTEGSHDRALGRLASGLGLDAERVHAVDAQCVVARVRLTIAHVVLERVIGNLDPDPPAGAPAGLACVLLGAREPHESALRGIPGGADGWVALTEALGFDAVPPRLVSAMEQPHGSSLAGPSPRMLRELGPMAPSRQRHVRTLGSGDVGLFSLDPPALVSVSSD